MKRILVNSKKKEELFIAFVDGKILYDLDVEYLECKQRKLNIYKGKIIRIESSLNAVFVDYGSNKNGFLPFKEISKKYFFKNNVNKFYHGTQNSLKLGQECIVQIRKQERGKKGVSFTTFISLVSSYLVLMPESPKIQGISKKINGKNRVNLKKIFSLLKIPRNMGLIIRTSGFKQSAIELQIDLDILLKNWKTIKEIAKVSSAPILIHQEGNVIFRVLRDCLYNEIDEILIDNPIILKYVYEYIHLLRRNDFTNKIKLYTKKCSLFKYYQIESQINSVFQRVLKLPSGGSITIDTVEALTAIDINSAHSKKYLNIEQTAFNTNLEAIYEISRQLRLRDLGGLIVIDFIDMKILNNRKLIIHFLRNILRKDRACIKIGSISKFGLLEMSRQRLSASLEKFNYYCCSICNEKNK
ncbi:MAG: Rne/Rng family ribonuclease [Buchnera aphidicola (Nurudea yanoniella)]